MYKPAYFYQCVAISLMCQQQQLACNAFSESIKMRLKRMGRMVSMARRQREAEEATQQQLNVESKAEHPRPRPVLRRRLSVRNRLDVRIFPQATWLRVRISFYNFLNFYIMQIFDPNIVQTITPFFLNMTNWYCLGANIGCLMTRAALVWSIELICVRSLWS